MATLHCVYDPYCGWCYGAAPLLHEAANLEGLDVRLHGGGMLAGANRQPVTPALRAFIMGHTDRIVAMTGQPFGPDFTDGLLNDRAAVMDSEPPTAAILAAGTFGKELAMLDRIQRAHFIDGQRIADSSVLAGLAEDIGIERTAFENEFTRISAVPLGQHISESRALLHHAGGNGFPTFILENGDGFEILPSSRFLGRPREWGALLSTSLNEH